MSVGTVAKSVVNWKQAGQRLREIRALNGLTQGELAARLGIYQPDVSEIENGNCQWGIERLYQFAEVFGMPPVYLFRELFGTKK